MLGAISKTLRPRSLARKILAGAKDDSGVAALIIASAIAIVAFSALSV